MRLALKRVPGGAMYIYSICFIAALLLLPLLGVERLNWHEVTAHLKGDATSIHGLIFFRQRIPRVLLAMFVGGALSLAGAALQVLFRNPLAEPWTLGIAGGAAVGAFVSQVFPALLFTFGPLNSTQALALLGGGCAMALVWTFSRKTKTLSPHALLLAGVTLSIISGGVMMLLTQIVSPFAFVSLHRWLMGGLDVVGYRELLSLLVLGIPGVLILFALARDYNHLAFGEDMALGQGVDVAQVRQTTFLAAGLVTAACVAVAGPIGFVGMIVPHIVRRFSGFDHRVLLPGAFLLGGTLLACCDGLARTIIAPTEIPVGVITAVLGGPVFLCLLGRR